MWKIFGINVEITAGASVNAKLKFGSTETVLNIIVHKSDVYFEARRMSRFVV